MSLNAIPFSPPTTTPLSPPTIIALSPPTLTPLSPPTLTPLFSHHHPSISSRPRPTPSSHNHPSLSSHDHPIALTPSLILLQPSPHTALHHPTPPLTIPHHPSPSHTTPHHPAPPLSTPHHRSGSAGGGVARGVQQQWGQRGRARVAPLHGPLQRARALPSALHAHRVRPGRPANRLPHTCRAGIARHT
ncbi:unnamed protein product [Closterium sp. NIES-54]